MRLKIINKWGQNLFCTLAIVTSFGQAGKKIPMFGPKMSTSLTITGLMNLH
jgi:hypothetical protein